jgi:DNA polymerase-3 subunit epsilon
MTSRPHRASIDIFGRAWWPHFIDTLATEKRRLTQTSDLLKAGALTLGASRSRYGLPGYLGHNALIDAWATAELLLAQMKKGATLSPLWSG